MVDVEVKRVLHFVRHGQYVRGADGVDQGLTDLGRKQARRLARHFRRLPIHSIVSSDAPRAIETATILAGELAMSRMPPRPLLAEIVPTHHTGVTCFEIRRRGVSFVTYNELGHLPAALRSSW